MAVAEEGVIIETGERIGGDRPHDEDLRLSAPTGGGRLGVFGGFPRLLGEVHAEMRVGVSAAPAAPEIEGVERVGSAVEDDPVVLAEGGRGRSLIHVFAGPRSFATLDRVAERNNRVMRSSAPYCGRGAP